MINIPYDLSVIISGKEKIPISYVEIYDTTNTVPSSGFFVRYFSGVDTNLSGSIKRTQFEPIIMKDWSNGLPVELSNYVGAQLTNSGIFVSDPYSVTYSGFFYTDTSGLHKFATRAGGGTEILINNIQVLSGAQTISSTLTGYSSGMWDTKDFYWFGYQNLNSGWHNFKLNYYWNSTTSSYSLSGHSRSSFLTAFYTKPNGRETILSASAVSVYSGFVQPTVLTNVIMVNEDIDDGLATQCTFEVAIKRSGLYDWQQQKQDFGALKINRLCKVHIGYITESDYTITNGYTENLHLASGILQKFAGLIDAVNVEQTKDSVTATVSCRDFFKKLINGINENYPNKSNYTPIVLDSADRVGINQINNLMPMCYDNWSVFDVLETIAINGGIDPQNINRNKWDQANYFKMESNLNWPYTSTTDFNGVVTKKADPFIFQFEYGEQLYEGFKRVGDLIGYSSYFDESGDLVVKEPKGTNRIEVYETGTYGATPLSYSSSAWPFVADINASNRVYISGKLNSPASAGDITILFSGVGISAFLFMQPSGAKYNFKIYDNSTSALVFDQYYSGFSSTNRYNFFQEYTKNLPYGGYTAILRPSGDLRIEGFEYYTKNIFKPVYTLKDNVDIINIKIDQTDDYLRNEIIAIGQQVSDKGYLYSKSIDLDSISNPDAFNYVGSKRTFTLIEPTIQSQRRLDWLAKNILEKFRRKQRNISVDTQGLPHLQIGDPVGIKTNKLNLNSEAITSFDSDNEEVYYINKISSKIAQGEYTTSLSLTNLRPIESWRPPLPITTDVINAIYLGNNNTIFSNFKQLTLNSSKGYGYDGFSEQGAFISFDLFVDVDRLWVLVADSYDGAEIFKYIDVDDKTPLIRWQNITGGTYGEPPRGAVFLHNGGGEKWGNIVVPTAQNDFNGGQWIGQNSEGNVRRDGSYPIAIWAQYRNIDGLSYIQGMWVPASGTLDNRNRQLAFSSTTSGNKFFIYTVLASENAFVPDETSSQKAYLPSFVQKNSDFLLDMWIGPIASGYQLVNQNKLTNLSGYFSTFSDRWSLGQAPNTNSDPTIAATTKSVRIRNYKWNYGPGLNTYKTSYASSDGLPWTSGMDIFPVPDSDAHSNPHELFDGIIKGTKSRSDKEVMKNVYGWTYMGADMPNLFPTYANPGIDPFSTYFSPPYIAQSGIETIFHEFNPFIIKANHDFYLTVQTLLFDGIIDYTTNGFVSSITRTLYEGSTSLPIGPNTPLAFYVTDRIRPESWIDIPMVGNEYTMIDGPRRRTHRPAGGTGFGLADIRYKLNHNVIIPSNSYGRTFFKNGEMYLDKTKGEYAVVTRLIFTEAKSGRKYVTNIRWATPGGAGWSHLPYNCLTNFNNESQINLTAAPEGFDTYNRFIPIFTRIL